jgi:hypothetical protein
MTMRLHIYFLSGSIFTQGQGKGAYNCMIWQPFYLSGSLFTLPSYSSILAEVTIHPARVTALFVWCQDHYSHDNFCLDIANRVHKRTAKQALKIFTIIKFKPVFFWTSQGHYWPLVDKVGLAADKAQGWVTIFKPLVRERERCWKICHLILRSDILESMKVGSNFFFLIIY